MKQLTKATLRQKRINKILILIFAVCASIIIRYFISSYNKTICVYHDEMTYLSLARSLAKDGTRRIYNLSRSYDNLLYSLLIAPATLVSDVTVQLKIISFINSVLLSLGVIPIYFLAKKFLKRTGSIAIACLIYLIGSDLSYACSFMRENLYLPLGLLVLYLMSNQIDILDQCRFDKTIAVKSIITGLLFWLWFFCKRTCFPSLVALYCYQIALIIKRKYKHQEVKIRKEPILVLLVITISFFVPYLVTKCTIFSHDNINQLSVRTVYSAFTAVNGYYCFIYLLLIALLGYTFFPFFITFLERHKLSESVRHYYYFIVICIIITIFWIGTNTNVNEDLELTLPRVHLRYLCCFYMPLVICFFSALEVKAEKKTDKKIILIPVLLIAWYGYYFLLGEHLLVNDQQYFDQTQVMYFALADTKIQLLDYLAFASVTIIAFFLYYQGKVIYRKVMIIC